MHSFIIGFLFSFIGSVPPGTLNLSIVQLGLENRLGASFRFAIAAAIIEYPYAFIAVFFEKWLTSNPFVMSNFTLIAGFVMILLGYVNIRSATGKLKNEKWKALQESGFRKGVVLSILNPLAIPFWVGVTGYLKSQNWIQLPDLNDVVIYVAGISAGTFALLYSLALISSLFHLDAINQKYARMIPGIIFIILGIYSIAKYLNLL